MRRRDHRDERGVTMVLLAGVISVLVLFVAIVIDLGKARSTDQINDAVVDDAVLAGAAQLDDGDAEAACETAWAYIEANVAQSPLEPDCQALAGACVATTPRIATVDLQGARYRFISPIPDGDPLLGDQPPDANVDQDPCDRFAVTVEDASDNVFASGSIDLESSAVAAQSAGTPATGGGAGPAPIVLLDPTGCNVLTVDGSSVVQALAHNGYSGVIHVDSDGSECRRRNEAVVEATGNSRIYVDGPDGALNLFALSGDDADHAVRITGSSVVQGATSTTERHGRQPVDDRYGAAITSLDQRLAGSGAPDGFRRWTEWMEQTRPFVSNPCKINGGTHWTGVPQNGSPYPIDVPADNWYIDCPQGLDLGGNGTVVFRGGDIVMERPIDTGPIPVAFNCPSGSIPNYKAHAHEVLPSCGTASKDSTIVVRNGDAFISGGNYPILLPRTFVYAPNGTFDVGSSKSVYWTAPHSGDFEDLLFWSESDETISLAGSSLGVDLEGVFFAPNAVMNVQGHRQLTNQGAQTFLKQLHLSGNTRFEVYPLPDRQVTPGSGPAGPGGVALIR